jgi:hypothetical protein
MRKILSILFLMPYLLLSQSIYPLPFTFDDENLFVANIVISNSQSLKDKKISYLREVMFVDAKNNYYVLFLKYPNFPICIGIKNIDEFYNHKNEKTESNCSKFIKEFFKGDKVGNIIVGNHTIVFSESKDNETVSWSLGDLSIDAHIFYNNQYVASLEYISPNSESKDFYDLLRSIKKNKNIYNAAYYLKEAEKSGQRSFNKALKNAVSVLMLEPTNKEIKPLLQEIYDFQKSFIILSENSLKNLESE